MCRNIRHVATIHMKATFPLTTLFRPSFQIRETKRNSHTNSQNDWGEMPGYNHEAMCRPVTEWYGACLSVGVHQLPVWLQFFLLHFVGGQSKGPCQLPSLLSSVRRMKMKLWHFRHYLELRTNCMKLNSTKKSSGSSMLKTVKSVQFTVTSVILNPNPKFLGYIYSWGCG